MAGMRARSRGRGLGKWRSAVLDAAVAGAAGDIAQLDQGGQKMLHHGFLCRFRSLPGKKIGSLWLEWK